MSNFHIYYSDKSYVEDVVTKVEKSMLRWFGHVEKMSER